MIMKMYFAFQEILIGVIELLLINLYFNKYNLVLKYSLYKQK